MAGVDAIVDVVVVPLWGEGMEDKGRWEME